MRVIVTGPKGVGKSTAVRRAMQMLGWNNVAGFYSRRVEAGSGEIRLVFSTWHGDSAVVARWPAPPKTRAALLAGLDSRTLRRFAREHLAALSCDQPLVIDELGMVELQDPYFLKCIARAFRHPTLLAVIQQRALRQWTAVIGASQVDHIFRIRLATRRQLPRTIVGLFKTARSRQA